MTKVEIAVSEILRKFDDEQIKELISRLDIELYEKLMQDEKIKIEEDSFI